MLNSVYSLQTHWTKISSDLKDHLNTYKHGELLDKLNAERFELKILASKKKAQRNENCLVPEANDEVHRTGEGCDTGEESSKSKGRRGERRKLAF